MATAKKSVSKKPAVKSNVAKKNVQPAKKAAKKTVTQQLDETLAKQGPFINKPAPKGDKKAAAKAAPAKKSPAKKADGGTSKMALATDVYLKMKGQPRKDILAAFQEKAKLTPAGSNTYLAVLRKKHG